MKILVPELIGDCLIPKRRQWNAEIQLCFTAAKLQPKSEILIEFMDIDRQEPFCNSLILNDYGIHRCS